MEIAALRRAFRRRRVLVTGDTGFKGSWLCLLLQELGAEVAGYARPPQRRADHYNAVGLARRVRHVDGDLLDGKRLRRAVAAFEPEFLFHLAAQALVRRSYDQPKHTFDVNVGGTVNVLEAARECRRLRALVVVTSDKCYRNKGWAWGYREDDELGGRDPYSASKAAAELVCASYRDSFFSAGRVGLATARAGNVIGGGDWSEDRIVPDALTALLARRPLTLRNPGATRPWQHVLDPLLGYLTLAAGLRRDPPAFSQAWNFGPSADSCRTVAELVSSLSRHWGEPIRPSVRRSRRHEESILQLNCDKSLRLLGWRPRWDFERSVGETARWHRTVSAGGSALECSLSQIREFLGEAR